MRRSTWFQIILGLLLLGLMFVFARKNSVAEKVAALQTAADEMNKRVPYMVDEQTRMDRTEVGPDARMTYHLSFPDFDSVRLQTIGVSNELPGLTAKGLCGNESIRPTLEDGVVYSYVYSGNDGVVVSRFEVTAKDCPKD